ncbi:10174_t:CDS:1, partial [Funneliformis caledonium]
MSSLTNNITQEYIQARPLVHGSVLDILDSLDETSSLLSSPELPF